MVIRVFTWHFDTLAGPKYHDISSGCVRNRKTHDVDVLKIKRKICVHSGRVWRFMKWQDRWFSTRESIIPDKTWTHFSILLLCLSSVCSNSFVLRSVMFLLAITQSDVVLCHAGSFGCELTRLCLWITEVNNNHAWQMVSIWSNGNGPFVNKIFVWDAKIA